MNLQRCKNGHFFDADRYPECPHCAGARPANATISFAPPVDAPQENVTMPEPVAPVYAPVAEPQRPVSQLGGYAGASVSQNQSGYSPISSYAPAGAFANSPEPELMPEDSAPAEEPAGRSVIDEDNNRTIGIFAKAPGVEPVVGWLVCVKGDKYGQDYRLHVGRNSIGRNTDMDVCLSGDRTVSRDRHAIVIFEPKQAVFILQPGSATALVYLNNEVVLNPVNLKAGDVMQLGQTELRFVPLVGDDFSWGE